MAEVATTREFTIRKRFAASRGALYRAWTEPARLTWFFNPDQPRPHEPIEVDLRVGGAWRLRMVIDEQTDYLTGGVYREIVPDRRLVFVWGAVGGWPDLTEGLGDAPVVTVDFDDAEGDGRDGDVADGGAVMTVTVTLPAHFGDADARRWLDYGIEGGWRDTVARLVPAADRQGRN
ncbi:SRPBCC domain-containing protein [Agromyces tardus]|jgi:uncharacterized protein YndB with AHSA1/START domain|uniref:SRPBCC domain-containing protein n=1 Tax=Agromyces tardus TaxID=2583849 RepID=A0A3M8APE8_9MICO|nr:SRPBCC domain-containing protein [Agromyces tardus]RNB52395.1 SRPBCC domain-containing protein [Agromyces tardus]